MHLRNSVEEELPLKQGLKPLKNPVKVAGYEVEEELPLKQGLKRETRS